MKKRFINILISAAISLLAVFALHMLNVEGDRTAYMIIWLLLFRLIFDTLNN